MKKFDFGGVIIEHRDDTQSRGLESIDPQEVIETIQVAVTFYQALKILIASIKNTFFKK